MVITDIVHQISIYLVQKIYHVFLLNNIIFYAHDSLNSLYIYIYHRTLKRFRAVQGSAWRNPPHYSFMINFKAILMFLFRPK